MLQDDDVANERQRVADMDSSEDEAIVIRNLVKVKQRCIIDITMIQN